MYITFYYEESLYRPEHVFDFLNNRNTFTLSPSRAPKKHTRLMDTTQIKYLNGIPGMTHQLEILNRKIKNFKEEFGNQDLYHTFFIPKKKGGTRRIDAPNEELKKLLQTILYEFNYTFKVLSHNSAYAYERKRSCKEAMLQHQKNESKWFLKTDIKDFFPTCHKTFIVKQLMNLYPFAMLAQWNTYTEEYLTNIIDICCRNDVLPQGSPMSPILSNLIMVSLDYQIQKAFHNFGQKHFIYTRYADDILLSCKYDFNATQVTEQLKLILRCASPFQLNEQKTRYASSSGRNWNLGLMLNKDNELTVGHKKKTCFKAILHNFACDFTGGTLWSKEDAQVLQGQLSYYTQIEPIYFKNLIERSEYKFNYDVMSALQYCINGI